MSHMLACCSAAKNIKNQKTNNNKPLIIFIYWSVWSDGGRTPLINFVSDSFFFSVVSAEISAFRVFWCCKSVTLTQARRRWRLVLPHAHPRNVFVRAQLSITIASSLSTLISNLSAVTISWCSSTFDVSSVFPLQLRSYFMCAFMCNVCE